MCMARTKKIFLAQVTKFRAEVAGDFRMVVDDQPDVGAVRDGQNGFRQAADFVGRGFFGAKLNQIGAAVTELLRHDFRRAAMQTGRVHESIEPAISERFHKNSLIYLTGENRGNGVENQISTAKIHRGSPNRTSSLLSPVCFCSKQNVDRIFPYSNKFSVSVQMRFARNIRCVRRTRRGRFAAMA